MGLFERLVDRTIAPVSEIRPVLTPLFGHLTGEGTHDEEGVWSEPTRVNNPPSLVRPTHRSTATVCPKGNGNSEEVSPTADARREESRPATRDQGRTGVAESGLLPGKPSDQPISTGLPVPANRKPEVIGEQYGTLGMIPVERDDHATVIESHDVSFSSETEKPLKFLGTPAVSPLAASRRAAEDTRIRVLGLEPLVFNRHSGGSFPVPFNVRSHLPTHKPSATEVESNSIHVTIGRVEVRAGREASPGTPANTRRPQKSSLDEYLRHRRDRKKR